MFMDAQSFPPTRATIVWLPSETFAVQVNDAEPEVYAARVTDVEPAEFPSTRRLTVAAHMEFPELLTGTVYE